MANTKKTSKGVPAALRWIALALLLAALSWFGLRIMQTAPTADDEAAGDSGGTPQGPPPASVLTTTVNAEKVQERRRVTGSLRAVRRARVAAREAEAVIEVHIDEGDTVKAGAPLVTLDDRRIRTELVQARANVTGAEAAITRRKAEVERAATDLNRKKTLYAKRAVAEREYLDAVRAVAVAEAQQKEAEDSLEALRSAVDRLEVRAEDLVVEAPFDGKIVSCEVEPGEWLSAGDPIATLVSTGTIEAWMNVPERFVGRTRTAVEGWSVVADGSGVSAPVNELKEISDIDPRTRLFTLILELDDQDGALVPGQSVHAEVPVSEPEKLLAVPVDAVTESFSGTHVFRVAGSAPLAEKQNTEAGGAKENPESNAPELPIAEKVPVTLRFRRDGKTYLDPGALAEGDTIVVEGNERLMPGTPLMASPQEEVTGSATENASDTLPPKP